MPMLNTSLVEILKTMSIKRLNLHFSPLKITLENWMAFYPFKEWSFSFCTCSLLKIKSVLFCTEYVLPISFIYAHLCTCTCADHHICSNVEKEAVNKGAKIHNIIFSRS